MEKANQNYWLHQSGTDYERQQNWRAEQGRAAYRAQEAWLIDHLRDRSEQLGRPLRVLDFGCGFGRMTRVLAAYPFVDYHGYDFSETMIRQLLDEPPVTLTDADSRIRVAPSVTEAFAGTTFDVVFTVSVLIHNARDDAARLLMEMRSLLRPEGYLLLIENQLVPFDLRENNWHGGCWVHDYVGDLAADSNVQVFHDVIQSHDVYKIEPVGAHGRSVSIVRSDGEVRPLDECERIKLSLPRLKVALQGLASELEQGDIAALEGQLHDFAETAENQQRLIDRLERELESKEIEITRLRKECADLREVQDLRKRLHRVMIDAHRETAPIHVVPVATNDDSRINFANTFPDVQIAQWQAARDTMYANLDTRFDRVCHIFHNDWMGIRSAVGALPGYKLAIPSSTGIPVHEIEVIMQRLHEHAIEKIVLHGISDSMYALTRALADSGFDEQYLVWHGTTAQWVWEDERRYAQMAIRMARDGRVKRFSAIRRGLGPIVGERNFAPQLVNMPPKVDNGQVRRRPPRSGSYSALAPSWNDLRKNLATNVLAAHAVKSVDSIYVVAKDFELPKWISTKVKKVGYRDHASMLELMATMDIVLNVTTIDCHPMVDLEAMSVGTPCVRGPLFLDGLETHPYVCLTAVDNPMSVEDVASCIGRVLDTGESELIGMMDDYKRQLHELSAQRYAEFLAI
ncbi:methyltransferase domain-containing protein [Burkholderia multivorans]|uniref:class I SAM-dependent methyltransferase n=1 Tax=Burkholderia multivorans TaxID=87883 RepID=UPI0019D0DC9F|nr:class I SAM-dependent methyltransferase [Burkholderia multivorans]MBN8162985.1 methyltransferase domain-containing protein [Burkholderia multivorans]MBN8173785.1 methyltransferase domain-containing protein [Burkholderia multivorans]QSL30222.1 methyltransferase domain-containing protein [Burkholderia multivorans]QSL35962.1 methyltransferase domain-containing protein [Burkholderia multivorans]QSL41702.1 methyltransferase domain-containing protein [Burkholderia multivorans]